jgi:hypothetical protein
MVCSCNKAHQQHQKLKTQKVGNIQTCNSAQKRSLENGQAEMGIGHTLSMMNCNVPQEYRRTEDKHSTHKNARNNAGLCNLSAAEGNLTIRFI